MDNEFTSALTMPRVDETPPGIFSSNTHALIINTPVILSPEMFRRIPGFEYREMRMNLNGKIDLAFVERAMFYHAQGSVIAVKADLEKAKFVVECESDAALLAKVKGKALRMDDEFDSNSDSDV